MHCAIGMIFSEKDYRVILKKEYEERFHRNARYTLRAFARDLELSSGRLSDVLNSKKGLSRVSAERIASKLGYSDHERELFCDLVDAADARAQAQKNLARLRLFEKQSDRRVRQLQNDSFKLISDWFHMAIVELIQLEDCPSDTTTAVVWMAKRLGITKTEVDAAIERLIRLELVKISNRAFVCGDIFTETMGEVSSHAIKTFHRQMVERALATLYGRQLSERIFNSSILSIDKTQIREAQEDIVRFRMEFTRKYGSSAKKNAVYGVCLQFFPMEITDSNHDVSARIANPKVTV